VTKSKNKLFGLSDLEKQQLIGRMRGRTKKSGIEVALSPKKNQLKQQEIKKEFYSLGELPGAKLLEIQHAAAKRFGIENPFFKQHDFIASNTTIIGGKKYINFSSYNYLGLCGHPLISKRAKEAIDLYGTSASASRPVSGERPIHRQLENKLAEMHHTEDAVIFVSGHATNVTTIGYLFGKDDLILHDSLAHNSIIQGALLSGAKRLPFPHNDWSTLDDILEENRGNYQRVLIVTEGIYSMDGDIPELDKFIKIKYKHKAFLMVDEAHSLGVLGKNGLGIKEHFGIDSNDIDILMGTLSKTLSACGGYIAGKRVLIENLKFNAPGFVYSVGVSPPVAAAALAALELLEVEPERTQRLKYLGQLFYEFANENGLDTGKCQGYAIVPIITGSSILSVKLANNLFKLGINVQPIIYPAVEERAARLRFFLNFSHTEEQIKETIITLRNELKKLKYNPIYKFS